MTAVVLIIVILAVVVVVAFGIAYLVRARRPDTVEVFQRQIDALSPEARKPVVEKLQQLDDRGGEAGDPDPRARPPAEEDKGGG